MARSPRPWEATFKAAVADEAAGRLDDAVAKLNLTLGQAPGEAAVFRQLGVVLHKQERYEAALAAFRRARDIQASPVQWSNIGIALRDMGRFDEAAEAFAGASALQPDHARYAFRHGYCLLKAMRAAEAVPVLERAVALADPDDDAELTLALALLTAGDLERGWTAYEARWRHKSSLAEPLPEKRWDGRPIDGRLLVVAEQGLGDALQFVRYAALARQRCGHLVVQTHKGSEVLMAGARGVDEVASRGQPMPACDAAIGMLSLPRLFGTTLETIPAEAPYIEVDAAWRAAVRARLAPLGRLRKIGIAWAGNPKHAEDKRRSIPFRHFLELLDVPGLALLSLQKGPGGNQVAACGATGLVSVLQNQIDTLPGTAALIAELDLVITCDTAIAHLAGALGRPVWILLSSTADWRWMASREDSPWYPTARLFRQDRPGDWEGVFRKVVAALREGL